MNAAQGMPLVAVDVGNSALHVGLFRPESTCAFPRPEYPLQLSNSDATLDALRDWAMALPSRPATWCIASVNERASDKLKSWLEQEAAGDSVRMISHHDCGLPVNVEYPQRVGIDRLMAVVAAKQLAGDKPAIVIDAGTAITVDLLADGAFQGGAILPGMKMSAAALDRYAEKLPLVHTSGMAQPDVVGRNTADAMKSGMFWGTVGAIEQLTRRIAEGLLPTPHVFITGGDAPALAKHLPQAEHVPDLVISGIALTAAAPHLND